MTLADYSMTAAVPGGRMTEDCQPFFRALHESRRRRALR